MNFLIIPIGVFMGIVALLILKEIRPNSLFKKALKVFIILLFIAAFVAVSMYFYTPKTF
jgi:hypothetical protein